MKKNTPSVPVAGTEVTSSGVKRKGEKDGDAAVDSKKTKDSYNNNENNEEDEATVLAQLATMGSAWGDEGDAGWETGPSAVEKSSEKAEKSVRAAGSSQAGTAGGMSFEMDRRPMSRIINRKTALPRCKLVAFLLKEYPEGAPETDGEEGGDGMADADADAEGEDGPILGYLKSLPPPAVDLEFRALCTHEEDEEGEIATAETLRM